MAATTDVNEAKFSQQYRLIKIKTTLGEKELLLEKITASDALSIPFEYHVVMLSDNPSIDLKSLLQTSVTITISLPEDKERYINGKFSYLRQGPQGYDKLVFYEGTIVPSVWFLSLDSDCRIFQDMTAPAIVEKVLKEKGVTDIQFNFSTGSYPTRDYCVQYRESTLNFISRLLEEEGIFYHFEHTSSKHTMVFDESSSSLASVPDLPTVSYSYSKTGWRDDKDGIVSLERIEQVYSGKVTLNDYNFETPTNNLKVGVSAPKYTPLEKYDYPGRYTTYEDGSHYTGRRIDERESLGFVVRGESRCRAFSPGFKFTLEDHYRRDTNQDYVLIEVNHQATDTSYRTTDDAAHSYRNYFKAIPKSVPYRPPFRARKPFVQGPQTALVVGSTGDEITVDKYGRVKVQFYWDRLGNKDEKSSCWIRVAQIWAGKNWGWMTVPRIGQEVIVDFLEGDPDRPIITGRVYNADQMPPYTLPANQTQSGMKSRSSKGGGTEDFNEIRFEDLKDSEMITVHAQKDMETTVEHDDTQTIQNNRTITVSGTHTETITKDTTITITEGNLSTTLNKGNETRTLDMGNQTITLTMGNITTTCEAGSITMEAMESITLMVGDNSIVIDQMGVTITGDLVTITGEMMTEISGDIMLDMSGGVTMINCG